MTMTVGDLRSTLLGWDDNCIIKIRDANPTKAVDVARTEFDNDWGYDEDVDEEYCECCGHEIYLEPERVAVLVLVGGNE